MIEEKEFLTCKIDQVFKTIVIDDKNHVFLEAILSNILGGKPKVVSLPRTVVKKDTVNEKDKDRDLVVELDGTYINLEVVTGRGKEVRSQLFTYHVSMWKQNIVKSNKYDTKTMFLQIVLQYGLSPKNPLFKSYKMQYVNEETKKVEEWIENFEVLQINMESLKKMWYDGITEDIEKYKYLLMLDMNKEELESLGKGDAVVEQYKKELFALNENPNFINTLTKERERVLMHNTALELAYENGETFGITQGITQGRKEQQLDIARKMLLDGFDNNFIVKYTKLPVEEIEVLRREN